MYALLEILLLAVVVPICTVQLLRRLMPATARRLQAACAHLLQRPSAPKILHWLGTKLAPAAIQTSKGCGTGGCSSCNGCSSLTGPQRFIA